MKIKILYTVYTHSQARSCLPLKQYVLLVRKDNKILLGAKNTGIFWLTWVSAGRLRCCQNLRWSERHNGGFELFSWTAAVLGFLSSPSPQSLHWHCCTWEATTYKTVLEKEDREWHRFSWSDTLTSRSFWGEESDIIQLLLNETIYT